MIEGAKTYLHCKACVARGQTQRLEIGITSEGLIFNCAKHGEIGPLTPEKLAEMMRGPEIVCAHCAEGRPHVH